MKRYICLLLALVLLLIFVGCKKNAAPATTNGVEPVTFNPDEYNSVEDLSETLKWAYNAQTGMLAISGEGAMPDFSTEADPAPWVNYTYTTVLICDGVTHIGAEAFSGNATVTTVKISGTVTSIGAKAFYACTALTEANISFGVAEIGQNAFSNCTSLAKINVGADNANYKSADGVLFTKDGKTLIQYPVGKGADVYKIPDGVETVSELAFGFCGDTLSTLEIPVSVTSIEKAAFIGCRVLTTVTYKGTETQWKSVKLAPENDLLTFAEFSFS